MLELRVGGWEILCLKHILFINKQKLEAKKQIPVDIQLFKRFS